MRAIRQMANVAIGLALLSLPADALVRAQRSFLTTIDLKSCRSVGDSASGNGWLCKGLNGYPVYYSEGAGRMVLSVGPAPTQRKAARQSLDPVSTLFEEPSRRAAIEWRGYLKDGKPVPYAAIVRTFTARGARRGEVLLVLRVTTAETCVAAKIDALATPGPIALARQIADGPARRFNCADAPNVAGNTGRSPM